MIWLHLAKPPVCAGTDVCTCMCAHKQRHEHGAQGVQEMSVCFQLWIRRQFFQAFWRCSFLCFSLFSPYHFVGEWRVLETACGAHANYQCSFSIRGGCGGPGVQIVATEAIRQDHWGWGVGCSRDTCMVVKWHSSARVSQRNLQYSYVIIFNGTSIYNYYKVETT